jgi:superfamily II DNA or RNA helicase
MEIRNLAYQNEAITSIIEAYKKNPSGRTMLVMPTGTGKTIVVRKLAIDQRLYDTLLEGKDRKCLRIVYKCHMHRLLTQGRRRFDMNLMDESSIENWLNPDYIPKKKIEIVFQMYSQKIPEGVDIDLIIYDECQHEACNTIQEFLSTAGKFPSLGLTATPERGDNCLLKFDVIVEPLSREDAVEAGYICESDIYTIVDTSSKNKLKLIKNLITVYHEMMGQTMVFVRTKKEINELTKFINETLNIPAVGVGEIKDEDDDSNEDVDVILDDFGAGKYKFLVSCKKLGEGVDIPGVTDVLIGRNVGSEIDLNQIIGRAARIDEMTCRVWEFVNALKDNNLDSREIVGEPKSHHIISIKNNQFILRNFNTGEIVSVSDLPS